MELYAGIDLHSNNSMVVVLDETDRVVYRIARLPNNLDGIISALQLVRRQIQGVAVESTFNWYWLVDGLQEAGYVVHLRTRQRSSSMTGSSTAAMQPMPGTCALCCAWAFCPRGISIRVKRRAVRDLLRKRSQLVRAAHHPDPEHPEPAGPQPESAAPGNLIGTGRRRHRCWRCCPSRPFAVQANLAVMHCLDEQIHGLEHAILERATLREDYRALQTVSGIGKVLALTIALETGDIRSLRESRQFSLPTPASVSSRRESNGKKPGEQNTVRQPAPGLGSSKRRTLWCATTNASSASTRRRAPARCRW